MFYQPKYKAEISTEKDISVISKKLTSLLFKDIIGEVDADSFKVSLTKGYVNIYAPMVNGRMEKAENGTKIKLVMKMFTFTQVFSYIWLAFCLGFLAMGIYVCATEGFYLPFIILPVCLLVLERALTVTLFLLSAKRTKEKLEKLI